MFHPRNSMWMDSFSYSDRLASGEAVMLIPVGAVEQHGPHMPLAVDALLATKMAELLADGIDGVVGVTVTAGYKSQQRSGGGNHLVGSLGFDAATVIDICRTAVREYHRHGVRKIVFVNGHFENCQFIFEGVDLALRDLHTHQELPQVMMLSYWDFVTDDVIEQIYPDGFPGWDVEHGGVLETSLMLKYFPDLVDMSKVWDLPAATLPRFDLLPVDASLTPASGCLSSAKAASAEKGQILSRSVVDGMIEAVTGTLKH